jgi:hypothetical protein
MYSDLNLLWESWLSVFTNNTNEAIVNKFQNKNEDDYFDLMLESFKSAFNILKPNRWMSIEFHNSKSSIWRHIQNAIIQSGFVIAQVATLDKKIATLNQNTQDNAVNNDLLINAYKPSENFYLNFFKKSGRNMEKEFIKMHLEKLPIESNSERTQQMLYSKLIAQYIQNSFEVSMDATEFYKMLRDGFKEINGFWFNKDQIEIYEHYLKLTNAFDKETLNQQILGVTDEKSAIIWLSQFLQSPKTYSDISISFFKNLLISQDKIPELKQMLDENFITEDGKYQLPSSIEVKEKEKIREKGLFKEFNEVLMEIQSSKTKYEEGEVRKEAILHGLMKLYKDKDVDTIKLIGERIDRKIIDSDEDISIIIDWALYN